MTDAVLTAEALSTSPRFAVARSLLSHRSFFIGLVVFSCLALAAVFAPWISSLDPSAMRVRLRFKPPQQAFLFGTDMFGRDVLTRTLYGARVSLGVGLSVALISGLFSAIIGVIAAQFRGLDSVIMRIMDALMSFPAILLALGITAALGPRVESVVIALAVAYIPAGVRIVRASALVVRELDYVQAAIVSGAGGIRIMRQHILPNVMSPLLVHMTFVFAFAILAEAALSFLGVGVQPPIASWGNIIAEGRDYTTEAWWIMLFPGAAISLAALSINLMGDGLRDQLDPRVRSVE